MSSAALAIQPSLKWSAVGSDFILKSQAGNDLYIAGYASVDMVDKQGDRIPADALKKAFGSFMENKAFRNVQLAHSGIQVGEVVADHTDSNGRLWKSEVDDHGLFVVCKIRSDIQKAREVQKQIRDNELRAFSIGGQALFRVSKHTPEHGSHREITELELHEVTLCKKGINPEARYTILKMENPEVEKMTDNAEALSEIRDGLARVLKHIDEEEPAEAPVMNKSNDTAVAYIDTLEKFAHEQGIDLDKLRGHFGLAKAYLPGDGQGYSHRGQGDEIGSGEDASEPTYPSLPAASGNKNVIKAPAKMKMEAPKGNRSVIKESNEVTAEGLERGYRAYAGMRDEENLKSVVKSQWEERYQAESARAMEMQKASDYSGQIAALQQEIASLRTVNADIQKSAVAVPTTSDIRIPTHEEFNAMGSDIDGWRAVEDLARRAIRGE